MEDIFNARHVREFFARCGSPAKTLRLIADWSDLRVLSLVPGKLNKDHNFLLSREQYRSVKEDLATAKGMLDSGEVSTRNQHFMLTVYRPVNFLWIEQRDIRRDAKELAAIARKTLADEAAIREDKS